jgi:hypothetical protein
MDHPPFVLMEPSITISVDIALPGGETASG